MHLKETNQRRKNELAISPSRRRSSQDHSQTIGSVQTGRINYHPHETCITNLKIRDEVRQAKEYIKNLKDPDILELKDKKWNISYVAPTTFKGFEKEENLQTRLMKIKIGLLDYIPVKKNINQIYNGTESRDDYTGWNVSTFFDKCEKDQGLSSTNANALEHTLKSTSQILGRNYKTLQDRYCQSNNMSRSLMLSQSNVLKNIKQQFLSSNIYSSPQKTNASVMRIFKELQNNKLKQSWEEDKQCSTQSSFKASLSPKQKSLIRRVYYHTGKWQPNPHPQGGIEEDVEENGWSCCMNSNKDSKGCAYKLQDGNKMNIVSFNY